MTPQQYLQKYPISSNQMKPDELLVIMRELLAVLAKNTDGDVVELGCYEGTSALYEVRILQHFAPQKYLWLYDSFQGLPPKTAPDSSPAGVQFVEGELHANQAKLRSHFKKAGLPTPLIKKAWFNQLKSQDLKRKFAHYFDYSRY